MNTFSLLAALTVLAPAFASAAPPAHVCSAEGMFASLNAINAVHVCLAAVETRLGQPGQDESFAAPLRRRAAAARAVVDGLYPEAVAGSQSNEYAAAVRETAALHATLRAAAEAAALARQERIMRRIGAGMGLHPLH